MKGFPSQSSYFQVNSSMSVNTSSEMDIVRLPDPFTEDPRTPPSRFYDTNALPNAVGLPTADGEATMIADAEQVRERSEIDEGPAQGRERLSGEEEKGQSDRGLSDRVNSGIL